MAERGTILILGGTTEGRMAADVCEAAGQRFFYSTLTAGGELPLVHGVRLTGGMTGPELRRFCRERGVRLVVDASHPFAQGLHRSVAESGMPVVRIQRTMPAHRADVEWCADLEDAVRRLLCNPPRRLLALTGVRTIRGLKPYWDRHETWFRILPREESLAAARAEGFPQDRLLFYSTDGTLPSQARERELMSSLGADAILTKESGQSGGYEAKVEAARELGLRTLVVRAPDYVALMPEPGRVTFVDGPHTLRRAIERSVPDFFPLHTGLTTGTCATAATKAALLALLGEETQEVAISLPDGETLRVEVKQTNIRSCDGQPTAEAEVRKDWSDDPDVTRGCRIVATVRRVPRSDGTLRFLQGEGVGRVTLPGLGIAVGEPAINPVPRQMMEAEVRTLTPDALDITISVPGGRELAERTFNPRVGVVDGLSIIGTQGIVRPLSNEAFQESIERELEVARAIGCDAVGLASGRRGELSLLEREPSLRVIHYGNFVGESLKRASRLGFRRVVLGIMIGKAVKLAEGHLDTHSHRVQWNPAFVAKVAGEAGVADARQRMEGLTMARQLLDVMPPAFFQRIRTLCIEACRTAYPEGELELILLET